MNIMLDLLELFGLKGFTNSDKQTIDNTIDMVTAADAQGSDLMPAPQMTQNTEIPMPSAPLLNNTEMASQPLSQPFTPDQSIQPQLSTDMPIASQPISEIQPSVTQPVVETPSVAPSVFEQITTTQAPDLTTTPVSQEAPAPAANPLTTFADITGINPNPVSTENSTAELTNTQEQPLSQPLPEIQNVQTTPEPTPVAESVITTETQAIQPQSPEIQQTVSFAGPDLVKPNSITEPAQPLEPQIQPSEITGTMPEMPAQPIQTTDANINSGPGIMTNSDQSTQDLASQPQIPEAQPLNTDQPPTTI